MNTTTTPTKTPRASSKLRLREADWKVLRSSFTIDTRALAVVRILVGALLLVQALFFDSPQPVDLDGWTDFAYRYTPVAMIPVGLMLMVGYKTRLAVILCWLVYSIPLRVDLLAGRSVEMGYYILAVALFWFIFLPLGRHLSVDSRRQHAPPVRFLSVASGALLFQIFIIYFSAGLFKDMGEWVIDATAMETILSHWAYETPLGTALLDYPGFLAVMSVATVVLEVVGSLLVIVPGKTLEKRRRVMVPVFILLHVAIAAFMGIGLFPYVMIALWLVFLPSNVWDRVWVRFGAGRGAVELSVDQRLWTNGMAGVAVLIATISNFIVWVYYVNPGTKPALLEAFQDFAIVMTIFQRWLMFNVPSGIPL